MSCLEFRLNYHYKMLTSIHRTVDDDKLTLSVEEKLSVNNINVVFSSVV